jgi:hypothetical protein
MIATASSNVASARNVRLMHLHHLNEASVVLAYAALVAAARLFGAAAVAIAPVKRSVFGHVHTAWLSSAPAGLTPARLGACASFATSRHGGSTSTVHLASLTTRPHTEPSTSRRSDPRARDSSTSRSTPPDSASSRSAGSPSYPSGGRTHRVFTTSARRKTATSRAPRGASWLCPSVAPVVAEVLLRIEVVGAHGCRHRRRPRTSPSTREARPS